MKVYRPHDHLRHSHTIFVSPANTRHGKGVADWLDDEGKPLTIPVEFKHGVAEVDGRLGSYLIDSKLAERSPILTL